jgi:hypothetical protein
VTATPDIVEFTKVPEMLLQLVLLVSEIAPVQSSLLGGRVALVVRQILKLATVPNPEASAPALFEILTKYVSTRLYSLQSGSGSLPFATAYVSQRATGPAINLNPRGWLCFTRPKICIKVTRIVCSCRLQ